jgi:8-oxo-dGTP pyrophosphatase MutT (NUDIX family)
VTCLCFDGEAMTSEPVRTFDPVPPAERPRRSRRTARVLLVDDADRLLLFADSDPGVPGRRWWITPGGGIDPGESEVEAAVRELEEEAGIEVEAASLVGPVLVRSVVHGYSDVVIDQEDVFFACWVPAFEVSDAGHTEEERLTMTAHQWWTREELAATTEEIWPVDLGEILADADRRRAAVAAGEPPAAPRRGEPVEESSVPAAM